MSLNRIVIMGRICKDVDMRATPNGTTVSRITVAVDRDFQADGTEKQTDFIEVVAFKHTASFIERNFSKGQMIAVVGRLQSNKWTDKDGKNRVSWEVIADSVYFGGDKKQPNPNVSAADFVEIDDDDGEIPF